MRLCIVLVTLLLVGSPWCAPLGAAQWGDLTGAFIYDGTPPDQEALAITKDIEFCGKHMPLDESLVVGKEGGIKNVIVYMYLSRGDDVPVHPDYEKTANDQVRLDNRGCRFEPRIVLVRTTQTLVIGNPDAVAHNTKVDFIRNSQFSFNDLIPANGQLEKKFPAAESLPATVSCSIHPWMSARIVVKDNPYFAVTDEQGKFLIKNVPVGEWTFQFYHEKTGYVDEVNVNGQSTKWTRGRPTLSIKSGENDLGVIKVAPGAFANN